MWIFGLLALALLTAHCIWWPQRKEEAEMFLTLFQPVWLLLLVPLAAAWFAWPLPNRGLNSFRAVVFVLVVLALAQLAIKLPDRAGTVIVVADRSESMPQRL